ncbi:MAG: hypothetical protein QM734_08485 [Cyclobacteriaceae bacterium]
MRLGLLLVLSVFAFTGNSQNILLLKNGEKIEFKSFKIHYEVSGDEIVIQTKVRGKLKITPQEILEYCLLKEEKIYRLLSNVSGDHDFYELYIEGPINIYKLHDKKLTYDNRPEYSYRFFLNDKNRTQEILFGNLFENYRSDRKLALKSFIGDEKNLISKVDDKDFKPTLEEIYGIVNEYNLSKFKEEQKEPILAPVFFYVKDFRIEKRQIKAVLNDKTEFVLSETKETSINLPSNFFAKVCVGSHCEAMKSNDCCNRWIEVKVFDNKVEFNPVSKPHAKFTIGVGKLKN